MAEPVIFTVSVDPDWLAEIGPDECLRRMHEQLTVIFETAIGKGKYGHPDYDKFSPPKWPRPIPAMVAAARAKQPPTPTSSTTTP